MMGLHHNYPVTWGAERMEGLTLDLGLDGMFSPLPAELNSAVAKDCEPPSWRFFGQSHNTQETAGDNLGGEDPCALLHNDSGGPSEHKPDMFELSLSSHPPQVSRQQQLINMKVEQEDVDPPSRTTGRAPSPVHSVEDAPFNCWRHSGTELLHGREAQLFNTARDENSPIELQADDDDTAVIDLSENTSNHYIPSSVPTTELKKQQPETIVLDDDTDDEFLLEERYAEVDNDRSFSPPPCGEADSRSEQEGERYLPASQSLPLRDLKRNVLRSGRNDDDLSSPAPASAVSESTKKHYGSLKEIHETCDWNQQQQGTATNSKRGRGFGDHDWLPTNLLDDSHSHENRIDAKRARRNDAHPLDSRNCSTPILNASAQCMEVPSGTIDMNQDLQEIPPENQAIQEMPDDSAEAFKELIRLVGAAESKTQDDRWGSPLASDVEHDDFFPLPSCATVNQPSSPGFDEIMEDIRSAGSDYERTDPLPTATTVNQDSPALDEIDSRHSVTSSDLQLSSSPPLATVDQPIFAHSPCDPSESANQSQCSPQSAVHGTSNADVVLYEPKSEPVESWRENASGPVVHVKQEPGLHFDNSMPYDRVSIAPVEDNSSALGQSYPFRNVVLTALDTFEQVRQQIIKDPSYGQPVLDPSQTPGTNEGSKANNRRLRADLKAACLMRKRGFWLNDRVRPIGEVPGVHMGDCFRYRIEMAVIGLHRAVQAGIAVVPLEYSPYGKPVASSVVIGVSDPYQDDNDMGDTVVYSGQGGLCGRTKESQDQKLIRGNLALSNSYDLKLPVRLIRGHKEQNSMTGILYSYDGLYQIVNMNYVNGVNGKKVFKFTMQRLPGQAPINGYPAPLGSQPPAATEPPQSAVHWTQSADVKPLYLEKASAA